jgi:hypothetical protein
MKNLNYVILSSFILLFHSLNLKAQSRFDVWPELKAFHTVMSQTFHPSEEGNLVKDAVLKIAIDSKKLHELIQQKASDKMISNALEDLHNTFHLIVEKCSKKEEHH